METRGSAFSPEGEFTLVNHIEDYRNLSTPKIIAATQGLSVTQFLKRIGGLILQIEGNPNKVRLELGGTFYECEDDPLGMCQLAIEDFIRQHYSQDSVVSTISQRLVNVNQYQVAKRANNVLRELGYHFEEGDFESVDTMVKFAASYVHSKRRDFVRGSLRNFPYGVPNFERIKQLVDLQLVGVSEEKRSYLSESEWMNYGPGGLKITKEQIEAARKALGFTSKEWESHKVKLPKGSYPIKTFLEKFKAAVAPDLVGNKNDFHILVDALRYRNLLRLFRYHDVWMLEVRGSSAKKIKGF